MRYAREIRFAREIRLRACEGIYFISHCGGSRNISQ
jgi:hypothetical protein